MSVKRGSIVIPKKLASLALCGESETCEVDLRHVYSYVILGVSETQREFIRVKVTLDILDKLSWSEKKLHLTYYATLCNATPPHVLLRAFSCLTAVYCTFL